MYGAPERELLQSYCERKEWTICDGKTVPQPPPRYRCHYRHQDYRCCEGAGVTGCFLAGLCNRWRGENAQQITYSKFGRWILRCVFFLIPFTGALRWTQLRPMWCPSQTQLYCQTGKQTAVTSKIWRSSRPRFRPGWQSPARRLPTSRCRSKELVTSGICGLQSSSNFSQKLRHGTSTELSSSSASHLPNCWQWMRSSGPVMRPNKCLLYMYWCRLAERRITRWVFQ